MLNLKNQISFGGKLLSDFGVYVTNAGVYDKPKRDIEQITIPGKNGKLEIDNERYENVIIRYPAVIYKDFKRNLDGMSSYLLSQKGKKRIENSFEPEFFRLGSYYEALSVESPKEGDIGKFDLAFDCDPQKWLKSGEEPIEIESEGMILSPVLFNCKPLIRIYETGTITINGISITVNNLLENDYANVDCEIMHVYNGDVSLDKYTTGEFPVLTAGENEITCTSKIDIIPRWWEL